MLDMPEVPEAMADAVRRAAAAMPATVSDLDGLRQRYRRRRKRRMATASSLAAVCVGVAGAGIPLLVGGGYPAGPTVAGSSQAEPASSSPAAAVRPAQRMMLAFAGELTSAGGSEVGVVPGARGIPELLADGRVHYHPLSGMDGVYAAVPLPDGRLVLTGYVDLTPDAVGRTDGPWVPGLAFKLVVLRADGSTELSRDIRVMGEEVILLGATGQHAYLLRPGGLFAHDFATGAERLVLDSLRTSHSAPPFGQGVAVASGRLAVITDQPDLCTVSVFDLASGQRVADVALSALGCFNAQQLALSPDGTLVAVTYSALSTNAGLGEVRLAILDVATGAVRLDRLFIPYRSRAPFYSRILQGMAWHDPHTLRMGVADLPAQANRVYRLEEVLVVDTVTVPRG